MSISITQQYLRNFPRKTFYTDCSVVIQSKDRRKKTKKKNLCFSLLGSSTISITLSIPITGDPRRLSFLSRLPFLDVFFVFFLSDIVSFFTARGVSVAGGLGRRRGNQRAVCVFTVVCVSSRCPSRLFSASRAFVANGFHEIVPSLIQHDTSLLFSTNPTPKPRIQRVCVGRSSV